MKLTYDIDAKPKFGQMIVFAFQQLLAIMAATIAVPMITSNVYDCGEVRMSTVAALLGAGMGTLVYVLFTKKKSPVFLGSSLRSSAPWLLLLQARLPFSSATSAL